MKKTGVVWFRNDLRLTDHVPLSRATASCDEIIPVYVFDPNRWRRLNLDFPKTGQFQTRFLLECVENLRQNLQETGSDLIVKMGDPAAIVSSIAAEFQATSVFTSKETTWEETELENKLELKLNREGIHFEKRWHSTLFHEEDIPWPIKNLPDIFTDFRKENEKSTQIREVIPAPTKIETPDLPSSEMPGIEDFGFMGNLEQDDRTAILARGGETEAWKRLERYFWETDQLKNYKWTRNGLVGEAYSSKLSLWLTHGCISPRSVNAEVKRYEREREKNISTYWLFFELVWRDYFRFIAKKYGNRIFRAGGIKNKEIHFNRNRSLFDKWKEGQTGVPFIDANMRELRLTGFMSNRGRQNVASFLVKDLDLDWTWGAAWFESQLIDYDACSNWGNWMYQAGVGNDPRNNRYFNILSQATKYDSKGEYVRTWVPELAAIPGGKIHAPFDLPEHELTAYGIVLDRDYPNPIMAAQKWL